MELPETEGQYSLNGSFWEYTAYNSELQTVIIGSGCSRDQARNNYEEIVQHALDQLPEVNSPILTTNKNITETSSIGRSDLHNNNNVVQTRSLSTIEKLNPEKIDANSDEDSEYEVPRRELERIAILFPLPKNKLHNISTKVENHTKKSMLKKPIYHLTPSMEWSCILCINWPTVVKFMGYGRSKQESSDAATIKVLHYLLDSKCLVGKTFEPNFYSKVERQKLLQQEPANISLPEDLISEVRELNKEYNDKIIPALDIVKEEEKERNIRIRDGLEADLNLEQWSLNREELPPHITEKRNSLLKIRAQNNDRYKTVREGFPIYKHREEFLKLLAHNNIVVIKGEPGCGKSTQIPQYIMEEASLLGEGSKCNIIVTQPRRISAMSVSQRIAEERGERLGDVVGYQIRLNSILPDKAGGNILFCSTGMALRRVQRDNTLQQCSHIIIDEAHERDADTDTLLLLVRRALRKNPALKVIVMSATMNADLFTRYFDDCPAMHIKGFTYPVEMHFLDEAKNINLEKSMQASKKDVPKIYEDEVANVINWIDENRPSGAILCFLPGWMEITQVQKHLEALKKPSLRIYQAHSKLSADEQRLIFNKPPEGVRKVILSTNICETSITIDDVVYVVDTGAHKDKRILPSGLQCIDSQWISQASVNQRKGRAGRVQPGESFHLFTRARYERMMPYPTPEILRVPLEKIILDSKTYSRGEFAAEYLSEMPEPPPEQRIEQAVAELEQMSALDEDEELTALGRRIALFSLPPKLSKALVHATIFKSLNPMLTIAALYATELSVFSGIKNGREDERIIKNRFNKISDHVAMAKLYDAWESGRRSHLDLKVNRDRMNQIKKLREIHAMNLRSCGILDEYDFHDDLDADCNEHSKNGELIKAILMSGLDSVLRYHENDMVRGVVKKTGYCKNEFGQIVHFNGDSILYGRKEFPTPFICCISEVHSMERRRSVVSEGSVLSPLTVLLFSDAAVEDLTDFCSSYDKKNRNADLQVMTLFGKRIQLACKRDQVNELLQLRYSIWNILQYFIERSGKVEKDDVWKMMSSFRDDLLILLTKILNSVKPSE